MSPIGPTGSWPAGLDPSILTRPVGSPTDAAASFESAFNAAATGRPASAAGGPLEQLASLAAGEVANVNRMQHTADDGVHALLTGGDVNEAEVLTNVQKADLAFRMLLQVRNKLMDAYREIQQIQI